VYSPAMDNLNLMVFYIFFLEMWGPVGGLACFFTGYCKQYSMTSMHTAICISITQKASKWEGYFHSDNTFHFLLVQSEHFCRAFSLLCWYADVAASGAYVPLDGLFARSLYFNWDWTFTAFCCFFLHKSNSSNILVKCIWIYLTAL